MSAVRRSSAHWIAPVFLATIVAVVAAETRAPNSASGSTEAQIAYYRARLGGPGTYPAYARLGVALLQKARETGQRKCHQEALRHLRQSLSYQRNFEALRGMAMGLSEHHAFREALAFAEEAVATVPGDLEALAILFDIRLALGNARGAEEVLNTLHKAKSGFHALARLAALREYRGDTVGALEAMTRACHALDAGELPATARAWAEVRLGSLHLARCEVAEARQAYERALAIMPGYFFAQEHLAEWRAAQGQWQEAEKLFLELMHTRPEPRYRLAWAECCRRAGKVARAKRAEQKALAEMRRAARHGAQDPARSLALLLLERDDGAVEGLHWAQRDWEVRQDAFAADTLAWAYACNGQHEAALRLSEEALRSGTKAPAVLLHSGLIRWQLGRRDEGRSLIEQALACPRALTPREITLAEMAQAQLSRPR